MLRSLAFSLLSLTLLASQASAQTAPAAKPTRKPAPRMVPNTSPAARAADPLRNSSNNGRGQNNYAAPGEPITPPDANGKHTESYDGPAARPARTNTTISSPK